MASLTNAASTQNHSHSLKASPKSKVSALVQQYMDMFDPDKLEPNLLTKRKTPPFDSILQDVLKKKVKDFTIPINKPSSFSTSDLTTFMPLYQNHLLDSSFGKKTDLKQGYDIVDGQFKTEFDRIQQTPGLGLLLSMRQQQEALCFSTGLMQQNNLNFISNQMFQKNGENVYVKEEYIKQEDSETNLEAVSLGFAKELTNNFQIKNQIEKDSLLETDTENSEIHDPLISEEPVLAEFTKGFPDWDLVTIFSFLKSGKTKDYFERERKSKAERKLRKRRRGSKSMKDMDLVKQRYLKHKKEFDTYEEYKPTRSSLKLQERQAKNGVGLTKTMRLRHEKCKEEVL